MKRIGFRTEMLKWGPAVLLMAIIFLLSSTPSSNLPNFNQLDLLVKKGGHFTGYALLFLSFLRGFSGSSRNGLARAAALTVLYAVSDELHQIFVPGRHPSPVDILIDSTGMLVAMAAWLKLPHLKRMVSLKAPSEDRSS